MQDQQSESYSLKLDGNGISINRNVPQDVARAVVDIVMGGDVRGRPAKPAAEAIHSREDPDPPSLSLHEVLENSGAKRNPDKIAVIAHYMIEHEGQQKFARDELKGRFREAGEAVPANFPRDFNWAVKNGWIAEDPHDRGSYYVTKKGREAIGEKFSSDIRKKTGSKRGLSKRRGKKSRESGGSDDGDDRWPRLTSSPSSRALIRSSSPISIVCRKSESRYCGCWRLARMR